MSTCQVTLLGTGHGNVDPLRGQTSILLRSNGKSWLIDAGEPCAKSLRALGIDPGSLETVWLTHAHADHVGGLPLLLQAIWGDGRTTPLPVFLPRNALGPVSAWLEFTTGLLPPRDGFGCEWKEWQDGQPRFFGDISLTPRRTTHLPTDREAFAFDIQLPEWRIVFSGDLGSASDLDWLDGESVDLVICELSHISPQELAHTLRNCRIDHLVLTHVGAAFQASLPAILQHLRSALPLCGKVTAAADGMSIILA